MNRLSSKNMIDIRIVSNYYSGYIFITEQTFDVIS